MTRPTRTAESLPYDLANARPRPEPPPALPWGWIIAAALIGGALTAAGLLSAYFTVVAVQEQAAVCTEGCPT